MTWTAFAILAMFKNINLELKSALRTKYIFYQSLLYWQYTMKDVEFV